MRLAKMFRLARVMRLFTKYEDTFVDWMPVISFMKVICTLYLLGHFLGCSFYFFSTPEMQRTLGEEFDPSEVSSLRTSVHHRNANPACEPPKS